MCIVVSDCSSLQTRGRHQLPFDGEFCSGHLDVIDRVLLVDCSSEASTTRLSRSFKIR